MTVLMLSGLFASPEFKLKDYVEAYRFVAEAVPEPATVTTSGAERALSIMLPPAVMRVASSSVRWPGLRGGNGDTQAALGPSPLSAPQVALVKTKGTPST